jgi:Uma2 family endonuclease
MQTGDVSMGVGVIVIEEQVRVPADVCELENFRRWAHSMDFPEHGRFSFLAGEVDVDMSPEEIESHNKVKTDVAAGLWNWIRQQGLGDLLSDRAFLVNERAQLATEPDLMFCSSESIRDGRVRYAERVEGSHRFMEVVGAPDLVVEVVSKNSVRKDTKTLLSLYYAAGIREYWLIDARGEAIDFTIYERGTDGYKAVASDEDGYRQSAVMNRSFLLTREPSPAAGYWYNLLGR